MALLGEVRLVSCPGIGPPKRPWDLCLDLVEVDYYALRLFVQRSSLGRKMFSDGGGLPGIVVQLFLG